MREGQRRAEAWEKLERRIALFGRFSEGAEYLRGRRVEVVHGAPAAPEPEPDREAPRVYWEEWEKEGETGIRITVVVQEPYALMLGYTLCDQADELLRERIGYDRVSLRDQKTGSSVRVCAEYRCREEGQSREERENKGGTARRRIREKRGAGFGEERTSFPRRKTS